jgi:hypothetical protein
VKHNVLYKEYEKLFELENGRTHCWYFLMSTDVTPQAHEITNELSPGSIQGIVFFTGNGGTSSS